MVRRYEGAVDLPPNLDLDFLQDVVAFLRENANVAEQRVAIRTTEGSLEETLLADAVAAIEPSEDVLAISVIMVGPDERFVSIEWGHRPGPSVALRSSHRIELLGVVEALRQMVAKKPPESVATAKVNGADPEPRTERRAVKGRWRTAVDGGRLAVPHGSTDPARSVDEMVTRSASGASGSRRSRIWAWWRGNSTTFYVEIVSGVVVAALVALWALMF